MRKKLLCTVAALAMLSGLFVVGATPALAEAPDSTQNFLPDDTIEVDVRGLDDAIGTFLSDKDDGTDTLAHLTNVSTRETSEVRWFLCPAERFGVGSDGNPGPVDDNDELNGCDAAGTDTTGVTPEEGPGEGTDPPEDFTDEAYETFFNIPNSLEGDTVDVVAAACINSAAADFENDDPADPDERNCTSDVEDQVVLDDGQTGVQGAQTSSGEITEFCAISSGSSEDCELEDDEEEGVFEPDPEVDANFDDFPHGSNVPNDRFTIRATTSVDVTELGAFLTSPADAETDPNGPAANSDECDDIDSDSNSREWQCTLDDVPNNTEMELGILDVANQAGNGGNCSANNVLCKLDAHYVVSQERRVTEAVLSFKREGESAEDRDISLNAGCQIGNDPDTADANQVDDGSHLVGCFFDQFGAPREEESDPASFESEGVGFFTLFGGGCIPEDHNDDGVDEHCHSSSGGDADGEHHAEIESEETGTQTITFCHDEEAGDDTDEDHGCADETVTATATKSWGSGVATEVSLVFDDGGDPCEGDTFRENAVNEVDTLIACVFDEEGNEVDTNEEEADGELRWTISEGADDDTDTRFTETPPQETDPGSNEASVGLQARDPGTDVITVTLLTEEGDPVGEAGESSSVEKQVSRIPRRRSTVSIRHRAGPHRFVGSVNPNANACDSNRRVTVRRRDAGPDTLIGRDRTNANGRYVVRHRRTNRRFRYYAQIRQNASCTGDNSPLTPRVR